MRGYKICLGGFYGQFGAIIACFIKAIYIVQHSAKIAWDVDMSVLCGLITF